MTTKRPSARKLARAIAAAMPALDETGRRIAVTLYRTLAEGEPVDHAALAGRAGIAAARVEHTLASWPGIERDDDGRIVGFWGLARGKDRPVREPGNSPP